MPLFFVLSGLFFNEKTDFKTLLIKSVKALLIPYAVFIAIDMAVNMYQNGFGMDAVMSAIKTHIISLIGVRLRLTNIPIWFLFALFFIRVSYYFIQKSKIAEILAAVSGITIIALAEYIWYPPKCMYIAAFPCMIFYILGYRLKSVIFKLDKVRIAPVNIILIILSFSVLCVTSNINNCVNMYNYDYGYILLFFANAITGSIIFLIVSVWISKLSTASSVLTYYGTNSVIVMACHYYLCRLVLPDIMKKLGISEYLYSYLTQVIVLILIMIIMLPIIWVSNRYLRAVFGKKIKENNNESKKNT